MTVMAVCFQYWAGAAATQEARCTLPRAAGLLQPWLILCSCCRSLSSAAHLIKHAHHNTGTPCVIYCFDPLMGDRVKELEEEGCSLIWGSAALSDSVQQWVLHLTPGLQGYLTGLHLQHDSIVQHQSACSLTLTLSELTYAYKLQDQVIAEQEQLDASNTRLPAALDMNNNRCCRASLLASSQTQPTI